MIYALHLTINTHTTRPALTANTTQPPATHYHSMYIQIHIYRYTNIHALLHVYIQIYDIHLIYDI